MASFVWPPLPSSGGGGTVTAVTASSPLSSSGGTTPNISISNIPDSDLSLVYAVLAGRTGGQTLNGDTAAGGNLNLQSNATSTKGYVSVIDGSTLALGPYGEWFSNIAPIYDIGPIALIMGEQTAALAINNGGGSTAFISAADSANYPGLAFGKADGTYASFGPVLSGAFLSSLNTSVYAGSSGPYDLLVTDVRSVASQNISGNAAGSQLQLWATPNGSTTLSNYLNIGGPSSLQLPTLVNGIIYTDSSGNASSLNAATYGTVPFANGTTWVAENPLEFFFGIAQTGDGTISSTTFTSFANAPSITFNPSLSGYWKVMATALVYSNTTNDVMEVKIQNTAGSATVTFEQSSLAIAAAASQGGNVTPYGIYQLTAGTTYTFTVYAQNNHAPTATMTFANSLASTGNILMAQRLQ
jgi:hypothetical protein